MLAYFNYYGASGSGKTTTLNLLKKMLEIVSITVANQNGQGNATRTTFVIPQNGINHIVCVCTAGDDFTLLYENHEYFEANNAEIMVTASHENHLQYIHTYVHSNITYQGMQHDPKKDAFDYHEVKSHPVNTNTDEQNAENQKMADYLFELIMQTINI
ncbi:MAG: hypothetical protein MJ197_07280 [Bacteroidales bacterium]|nr:hypothetical protein [Bacteroidales bacterium]